MVRQIIGLVIGIVLGVVGGTLFTRSLPPPKGSTAEALEETQMELMRAERMIREMSAKGMRSGPRRDRSHAARRIMEDIKAGREVDLDDVFQASKPWMQDISPVLNRIRLKEQRDQFDTLIGEWSREYDLTTGQQEDLRQWLDARAQENADNFESLINNPETTFIDMVRFGREEEENIRGVDGFMEQQLRGEALERYRTDRLADRVESVQDEANRKLNRLDGIVELDPQQEDELFFLMARGADEYIPSMEIEGMTGAAQALERRERDEAIRNSLRPDQQATFDAFLEDRRREANEDLQEVGLRLPEDWDLFEDDDW